MPGQSPGHNVLYVKNIPSILSASSAIDFIVPSTRPAVSTSTYGNDTYSGIRPLFGPKDDSSIITIYGNNLNSTVGGAMYCQIGLECVRAFNISSTSLMCIAPPVVISGKVKVRLLDYDRVAMPGTVYFDYIEDPLIFDSQPSVGTEGSQLLVRGRGFLRMPSLTCSVNDVLLFTVIVSDTVVLCTAPLLPSGTYSLSLQTNGQHLLKSGVTFTSRTRTPLSSLWPVTGPSTRGGTIVTIFSTGFIDSTDMTCTFGTQTVTAVYVSESTVKCRTLPHTAGRYVQ